MKSRTGKDSYREISTINIKIGSENVEENNPRVEPY